MILCFVKNKAHDNVRLAGKIDQGGVYVCQVGTMMAAADRFSVTVHGRGGHAAMPHLAKDSVVAASAIVGALQHLVSRETSPTGSAVVTVAVFNTGEPHLALCSLR